MKSKTNKTLPESRKAKMPNSRLCDLTHPCAAIGSKRLPQRKETAPVLMSSNLRRSQNGSIRWPKVLIGSNGWLKEQLGVNPKMRQPVKTQIKLKEEGLWSSLDGCSRASSNWRRSRNWNLASR